MPGAGRRAAAGTGVLEPGSGGKKVLAVKWGRVGWGGAGWGYL